MLSLLTRIDGNFVVHVQSWVVLVTVTGITVLGGKILIGVVLLHCSGYFLV